MEKDILVGALAHWTSGDYDMLVVKAKISESTYLVECYIEDDRLDDCLTFLKVFSLADMKEWHLFKTEDSYDEFKRNLAHLEKSDVWKAPA